MKHNECDIRNDMNPFREKYRSSCAGNSRVGGAFSKVPIGGASSAFNQSPKRGGRPAILGALSSPFSLF